MVEAMEEMVKALMLRKCFDCISENGILTPYGGILKAASITGDNKGILYTIRCDYPDGFHNLEAKRAAKADLDRMIAKGRFHLLVLQR